MATNYYSKDGKIIFGGNFFGLLCILKLRLLFTFFFMLDHDGYSHYEEANISLGEEGEREGREGREGR